MKKEKQNEEENYSVFFIAILPEAINKLWQIIVWVSMPVIALSQSHVPSEKQKTIFGINAGFNSSKIGSDTINFRYGVKPEIGFYANYNIFKAFYLENSVQYSIKGSNSVASSVKFENHYIDVNFIPKFQFSNDFYLQCGVGYSQFIFSKNIRPSGETKSGSKRTDNGKFISEINILSGLEFKLQENINVGFNYFMPTSRKGIKNFRLSLNILLNNKRENGKHPKIIREKAEEQITQLKIGTLLVRLKTSENKINALLKLGKTEAANKVRQQQEIENKKIIYAFKHYYNFSDLVFFYSNQSIKIRRGEFSGVFLNDSLSEDSSISVSKNKPVFIAEFSSIEQDTVKYFSHSTYEPDGNWSLKKQDHYYGGPDPGFDALLIRDEKFIQLKEPFPYYTRAIFNSIKQHPEQVIFLSVPLPIILFQNWSYNQTVKKMNYKLLSYYKKVLEK